MRDLLLVRILALWQWLRLLRRWNLNNYLVAGIILISAVVPVWHLSGTPQPAYAALIFNLLLFLLSVGLIREGLAQGKRHLFWGGMVLLTVSIFSRMLEYNTDLLFKSSVLFLCGLGLMGGGLWFVRRPRTRIVKARAPDKGIRLLHCGVFDCPLCCHLAYFLPSLPIPICAICAIIAAMRGSSRGLRK